jgi:ketosteroid isomerase-like protein
MNYFWMFKRTQGLFVLVAAAVLASIFSVLALAADMDENAKSLVEIDGNWSKAAVARDADKVASFYAEDAIAYPPSEPVAIGRPATAKVWSSYFSNDSFKISWKALHAEVAKSGDLGYTAGTYEDSFKGSDGKQINQQGKYVTVWKKQENGTWMVVHDIWNGDAK